MTPKYRSTTPSVVPSLLRAVLLLVPAAVPARALAGPAAVDEPVLHPRLEIDPRLELDPRLDLAETDRGERLTSPLRAPVWIALGATLRRPQAGDTSFGAMLLLGLPLDRPAGGHRRLAEPPPASGPALEPPPRVKAEIAPAAPPPKAPPAPPSAPPPPLRIPVAVTPKIARGAVEAALRRAHLGDPDARLDAMASRARYSAALPELRLRVLRLVDTGEALAPTVYDPTRTTAKDGASFWAEARGTWRLDRLLFADEEVALERMRHDRAEARARLVSRVLKLLFEWQRALADADNAAALPEENLVARLKTIEAEAELDLLTDGWFARWRSAP